MLLYLIRHRLLHGGVWRCRHSGRGGARIVLLRLKAPIEARLDTALRWLLLCSRVVIKFILAEALYDGPFRTEIFIIAAISYLLRLRRPELHEELLSIDDHLLLED